MKCLVWQEKCPRCCFHGQFIFLTSLRAARVAAAHHKVAGRQHSFLSATICVPLKHEVDLSYQRDTDDKDALLGVLSHSVMFESAQALPKALSPTAIEWGCGALWSQMSDLRIDVPYHKVATGIPVYVVWQDGADDSSTMSASGTGVDVPRRKSSIGRAPSLTKGFL